MRFLHTMIRVKNLEESLKFYCDLLGFKETRRKEYAKWKCTLVYLGAPENPEVEVELTYNWEPEDYKIGRAFGHLALEVDDIYATCQKLMDAGVTINLPPKDGWMAFVRSPDDISIELLQKGEPKPAQKPWQDMEATGWW